MGRWDRNNAELINVVFVWRAGLIQVRTWMRVYSWVDCIWKLPAIVPVGIHYRAAILFIMKLWKSCNWIMRLVSDGYTCLSHYCFVLTAGSVHHDLHYIYFQKYSRTGVTYNKASWSRAGWLHLGNLNISFPRKTKQNCGTVMYQIVNTMVHVQEREKKKKKKQSISMVCV